MVLKDKSKDALIVPGFNVPARAMSDLKRELEKMGFESVKIVSLKGHREKELFKGPLSAEDWYQDVMSSVPSEPEKTVAFGFSLGGLILSSLAARGVNFQHNFLLAPALVLNSPFHELIGAAEVLPSRFFLPSFAPKDFRANRLLHSSFYKAISECYRDKKELPQDFRADIFLEKKDELISSRGVEQFVRLKRLKNVELHAVSAQSAPRHLIVSPDRLDPQSWKLFETVIQNRSTGL